MNLEKIGIIKIAALSFGTILALRAVLLGAGVADPTVILFLLWVVSPYLLFFFITWFIERFTKIPARHGIAAICAVLMFAFSLLAYADTGANKSSTYGLIFIFAPVWLYIGGPAIYTFCLTLSWIVDWGQRRACR
jgi:hypothetical protein